MIGLACRTALGYTPFLINKIKRRKLKMSENKLEEEFKALLDTVGKEIDEKVSAAAKLLDEAIDLSDKHGVPFYSPVSNLGQSYCPTSFTDKFSSLDSDNVRELTEVYDLEGYGWEHSDIC